MTSNNKRATYVTFLTQELLLPDTQTHTRARTGVTGNTTTDVLPNKPHAGCNIDHTLPALGTPITPRQRRNGPVCCCMMLFAASALQCISMGRKFVAGDLDIWPWHSNSSERGTKHVFHANLAQIHSAVPEIFHTQTNKQTSQKNRTLLSSLHAVKTVEQ